jgi:outer membrane lipoprotein SlyB
MNTVVHPTPPSPGGASKSLWAAVGALSAIVIALGATLLYVQTRPTEPKTAALEAATPTAPVTPVEKNVEIEAAKGAPAKSAPVASKAAPHRTVKPAPTAQASHGPVVYSDAAPAPMAASQPVAPLSAKPLCINCATVTAVTAIQREGPGSGLGVVAGGVLGALVGNQVGGGNGRAAATILGAVGGGWAGNTVEKKIKKETVYQIQLRMEDGRTRMLEQMTPVAVGEKVTIEGNALRLSDGSMTTPVPVKPADQPAAPASAPTTG